MEARAPKEREMPTMASCSYGSFALPSPHQNGGEESKLRRPA